MRQHSQFLANDTVDKQANNGNKSPQVEKNGKQILSTDNPDTIIVKYGIIDEHSYAGDKSLGIDILRNQISSYLFEYLHGFHIPTYFCSRLSKNEMSVKRTDPVPFSAKVLNIANGTLTKRFSLKDGTELEFPIIEHYYENGTKAVSWLNEYHVYGLALATPEEFKQINRIASKVNAVLRGLCERRQLLLAEMKLEFGKHKGQVLLTGELSPVSIHFLDASIEYKSKKDRFSVESESAVEAISELSDRLMLKM